MFEEPLFLDDGAYMISSMMFAWVCRFCLGIARFGSGFRFRHDVLRPYRVTRLAGEVVRNW